ncbi:unnamed protein product [Agarophyton chilense]
MCPTLADMLAAAWSVVHAHRPACSCPTADTYVDHALRHAAFRATETQTSHPLVRDAAATHVSAAALRRPVDVSHRDYVQSIIQTRYRRDFLHAHLVPEQSRVQLVLLGDALDSAALDSAALRLQRADQLGSLAAFHVDFEPLVELNLDRLRKAGLHHALAPSPVMLAEHRTDWACDLISSGFDTCVHTVWLVDFTSPVVANIGFEVLLRDLVALSRPGSALLFQVCRHHHSHLLTNPRRMFRRLGFAVMHVDVVGDCNASFGRWCFDSPGSNAFIAASKNIVSHTE